MPSCVPTLDADLQINTLIPALQKQQGKGEARLERRAGASASLQAGAPGPTGENAGCCCPPGTQGEEKLQIQSPRRAQDTAETKWEPGGGRTHWKERGGGARDGGELQAFKSEENKSRWREEKIPWLTQFVCVCV